MLEFADRSYAVGVLSIQAAKLAQMCFYRAQLDLKSDKNVLQV